jgi:hypothetical protein
MSDFFKVLKYITFEKKVWDKLTETEKNSINPYLLHRYISMDQEYVDIANKIQKLDSGNKKAIYESYCSLIPKKNIFLKYIKQTSSNLSQALIEHISLQFGCSFREAKDYIFILGKEKLREILKHRGLEDKEIKKLLK